MGIQGLIPFLKKASRTINLSEFKGKTVVVDAYCWLHKGAFSCAEKLVKGEPTDGYILYVMKQVGLLLSFNIKPILVFDGCRLPAKEVTEIKRKENRERNKRKAKELLREGKVKEARECFQRCVDVTASMAHEVIKECRARNIDTIVAPYEADAQLAFLNHCGVADIVITEDSDLVLFGCDKIIFKLDNNGGGMLIEREKLHAAMMNIPRDKFDFAKFRNMCILSGCDYLPSLHGIGLAKSCRFFLATANPDVFNSLCKLPAYLKMPQLDVSLEYRRGFMRAIDTILHQLVFDPFTHTLRPLTPYPAGVSHDDMPYCGKFMGHQKALQIALGNIHVQTGEVIDNYDPLQSEQPLVKCKSWREKSGVVAKHPSIWHPNYKDLKTSLESKQEEKDNTFGFIMKGKERAVHCPTIKKRKKSDEESNYEVSGVTEDYLESLYKKSKTSEDDAGGSEELGTTVAAEDSSQDHSEANCSSLASDTGESLPNLEDIVEIENTFSTVDKNVHTQDFVETPTCSETTSESRNSDTPSRNPFAKKTTAIQTGETTSKPSKYSALFNFTTTSMQKNKIVRSRYFRDIQIVAKSGRDIEPQKENRSDVKVMEISSDQLEQDETIKCTTLEEEKQSSSAPLPLKPKNDSPLKKWSATGGVEGHLKKKGSFQWKGKLSEMFSLQKDVKGTHSETSEDMNNDASCLATPPLSQEHKVAIGSRTATLHNIYSSAALTPPPESSKVELFSRKRELSSGSPVLNRPKCRVSGLKKSSSSSVSTKQRQLNLKEMFGFQKNVSKLPS